MSVNLSTTNIVGLIIILIALVCMLLAKTLAEKFADAKYGKVLDKSSFQSEEDEINAVKNSGERKKYKEKVFIFFKLSALVLVVIAGLIVFLIK